MSFEQITYDVQNRIALITLNRPDQLNAWTVIMKDEIIRALGMAEEDDHVRVDLEIGAADVEAFRNLMPDALYERMGNSPRPLAERVQEFFQQDLVVASNTHFRKIINFNLYFLNISISFFEIQAAASNKEG